jgi:hypothetical protein
MAQSLEILSDSHPPKPRHRLVNLNPDNSDHQAFVNKDERIMAGFGIVRMVFDVGVKLPTILKEHLPTNIM